MRRFITALLLIFSPALFAQTVNGVPNQSITLIPISGLATQTANTAVANTTSSSASPTAVAIPSGIQNYVAGAGYNQATAHQIHAPLVCPDSSGSGTAQSCNTSPSFTPAANDCVIYTTTTANSGTGLTLNVNSLGATSVAKWLGATTLAANDVPAGEAQMACYNGTVWNLSTIGNAPSGVTAGTYWQVPGFVNGNTNVMTQNLVWCAGVVIPPGGFTVGHMFVGTQGTTNGTNEIGIYPLPSSGTTATKAADSGTFTGGFNSVAIAQGTVTISSTKNAALICATSNAASPTVQFPDASASATWYTWQSTGIASTGGALPSTITVPSPSPSSSPTNTTGPPSIVFYP